MESNEIMFRQLSWANNDYDMFLRDFRNNMKKALYKDNVRLDVLINTLELLKLEVEEIDNTRM